MNTHQRTPDSANRQVPSIVRAIRILDELVTGKPRGVSELARALGLPKSSIHGLCQTLADLGILARVGANQFAIGPHVLQWANTFQTQSSLTVEFQRLCAETSVLEREALNLSVLNGSSVMYVACKAGTRPLGVSFSVGMSLPAVFTATGKAMMSTMTPQEVDAVVGTGTWPKPLTSTSVRSRKALEAELEETRQRGYSIDNGQLREGMLCIGAPVFGANNSAAIAGLAVGLLAAEAPPESMESLGRDLAWLAGELSLRLGGTPRGK